MSKKRATLEIIHWAHEALERRWLPEIEQAYNDLRQLIDGLPENMQLYFDDGDIWEEFAVTGHAHASDIITIIFNPQEKSPEQTVRELRELIFHEGFHVRQGFTYEHGAFSGAESAVYEGCATVFEQKYAAATPGYGEYKDIPVQKLNEWYQALKAIPADTYFEASGETWRKWAFWDDETKEKWRTYKTGAWIVDTVLAARKADIRDLRNVPAKQILRWFEIVCTANSKTIEQMHINSLLE